MARTCADVIASVLPTLNDDGTRYTAPEMLGFVRDGLNEIKRMRPDAFLGQYSVVIGALTADSTLPVGDQFFRPLADYVIARCETKDAEHVDSGRATLMLKLFVGALS